MADIQLPGKGAVRAYQTGATMNPQAAGAPWAALASVGEAIGQAGNRYAAFLQKAEQTEADTVRSKARLELMKWHGDQMNSLISDPNPSTWNAKIQTGLDAKKKELLGREMTPLARLGMEEDWAEFEAKTQFNVAKNAALAIFQHQRGADGDTLSFAEQSGDRALQQSRLAEMRTRYPDFEVNKIAAESNQRFAYQEARGLMLQNPHEALEMIDRRDKDGNFENYTDLDPGQRMNLRSEAQGAFVGKLKDWGDWLADEQASGRMLSAEKIDERFRGTVPPRVIEKWKESLAQRQSEAFRAEAASPEYQQKVVGQVSGMLSGYRIGAEGYDEKFVEMDQLVKTLPTGSAVRDGLSEALTQARSGQRAIVKSNADAAQQALEDAYKSGRFGPTEFKAMKVSDAIQGGFLRDPAKLSALGFSEDQREAILAEKSDEKRRVKFQEFWTTRGDAAKDVDPLVWRTAEAIRAGADTATFLNGEDQAKLDATYRNYGKARTQLADWLRANPNADESKVTEKIKELGGKADVLQNRQSLIPARPTFSTSQIAPAALPSGLQPLAPAFQAAGSRYGVDPRLLAAISMHETANGESSAFRNKRNAMGVSNSSGPIAFDRPEDSIERMARVLSSDSGPYKNARSLADLAKVYAPVGAENDPGGLNKHWVDGVSRYYRSLGGDPLSVRF